MIIIIIGTKCKDATFPGLDIATKVLTLKKDTIDKAEITTSYINESMSS